MVSVISPVYNVAPYICTCIDSLRAQTMQDFEVLFIDDHGTDDSIAIAKEYTAGDERFKFLATPQNSGPGVARNLGIEAAQGDYISFIDSDDRVAPTFLEKLYQAAVSSRPPIYSSVSSYSPPSTGGVGGGFEGFGGGFGSACVYCQVTYDTTPARRNPVLHSGTFSVADRQYFLRHFVTFSVAFLFRRDFLLENDLRFPARRNSEDTNFLTRCLLLTPSIACVDEPLYVYCVHDGSLTTGRNRRRWRERLSAMNTLMRDFAALKRQPRYASLHLQQYNLTMALLWLKKGLAQAILEFI